MPSLGRAEQGFGCWIAVRKEEGAGSLVPLPLDAAFPLPPEGGSPHAEYLVESTEADDLERQNREVLAAMLEADTAPEPGTLRPRDILHRGDEELPAPVVAKVLTSAGYKYIYDTKTGERSLTNANMLPAQLRKVREDGTPVFTTKKPAIEPSRGEYKCLLHPSNKERPHYDELGFAVCHKSNLMSQFQVEQHMRNRHRVEWATIQRERQEKEREEERKLQRAILEGAARGLRDSIGEEPEAVPAGRGRKREMS